VLLLAALAVAVIIKTFLAQPFYIPSGSMIPTIEVDDRVMVSKLTYRFGEPDRGDIVVFRNPYAADVDESFPEAVVRNVLEALGIRTAATDDLIKRIVAIEGDELEIRENAVFVNGRALVEPYLAPGSVMPDEGTRVIPEGYVFVMGDNRSQSSDSRVFGPVPESDIIGEAVFRIWPLARVGSL
jgi:signal peptidase I